MTFGRAKNQGWTNDVDTITGPELEILDVNQSRALDGTAGGVYSPSSELAVNGSGLSTDNLQDSTFNGDVIVRGRLDLDGNGGRITKRVDTSTLGDADADITLSNDIWITSGTLTAFRTYTLRHTGIAAVAGDTVTVVFRNAGLQDVTVENEAASTIFIYNGSGGANRAAATVVWDGAAWRVISWSITAVGDIFNIV